MGKGRICAAPRALGSVQMFGTNEAGNMTLLPPQIINFFDASSVFIVIGCTFAIIVASFPPSQLKAIPKHIKTLMNTKRYNPLSVMEEKGNQQSDPFFKQCIMLIVDNNEADQVREIMMNDIEQSSARHEAAAGMYDRGSSVAPAFGMVGTLVGLINMLKGMNMDSAEGAGNIGPAMGTALITTLYGCILAHMIFGPIANQLRQRDEEETLCKLIIVEGIMSIQSGANPKFLREKLMTFMSQQQRDGGDGGKKGKKGE